MSERLDFYTISGKFFENLREQKITQRMYFETLFGYAFKQTDIIIEPDDTTISRILSGERSVSKDIIEIYDHADGFKRLQAGVSEILKNIPDPEYLKKQIEALLMNDKTISANVKMKLMEEKSLQEFITACLLFSLKRKFISQKRKGVAGKALTFHISDFLYNYHYPQMNPVFLGRGQELEEIHTLLKETDCLFLQGIGGIGKSELAKQFGKRFQKEYEHVIYLRYSESLLQTISGMQFVDDTKGMKQQERFEQHYPLFQMLDEKALVILDNFDALPEDDEHFHDFLVLPFRLIVTTRNLIEDVPCYPVKEIQCMEMLKTLFFTYAPQSEKEAGLVQMIIEEVICHTLTVEMAAKTLTAAALSPEELLQALRQEGLNLTNPNKVRVTKDAQSKKDRLYMHLKTLFKLQNIPQSHLSTLRHILLMPEIGISKRLFHKWLDTNDFNPINELIEYGWIQEDKNSNQISIHPFLYEVIRGFAPPSFQHCRSFIERLGKEYVVPVDEEIHYGDLLNLARSIFRPLEIDDEDAVIVLLKNILGYLEKYAYHKTLKATLEIMERMLPFDGQQRFAMAVYAFYQGIAAQIEGDAKTWKKHVEVALKNLAPIDESNMDFAIRIYENSIIPHFLNGNKRKYQSYSEKLVELRDKFGLTDTIDYDCAKMHQFLSKALNSPIQPKTRADLRKILENPVLESFFKKSKGKLKGDFNDVDLAKDIEKLQPNELLWKGEYNEMVTKIMEEIKASAKGKKVTGNAFMYTLIFTIMRVAEEKKGENIFPLSPSVQ